MKINFPVIVIFFLLFTVLLPAHAQTPTPDPCSKDAPKSAPCPVRYDTTNVVIPRSQSWVSSLVGSISQLLGTQIAATFNWAGILRPSGDKYNIGSQKFTTYGQQIQQSSGSDLKPAALQDVTIPDEQPKKFTMTSVECVHDPQTGAIVQQIPSSERIETGDIPGLTQTIEGSRQLGSYVTGYTQVMQDYNLKNVVVATDKVTCDSPSSGQNVEQTAVTSQNQNSYGGQSAISTIVTTITAALIAPFQGGYKATVKQTAEIQGKGLTPWMHYALCLFAGCKAEDVSSVSYDTDANKKQLTDAGGAVAAMYKPAAVDDAYKSDLNAADPSQQWNLNSEGVIATAVNYGQARVVAAGNYMNCTLAQADYQNTAIPDGACNTNWASVSSGATDGWNCDTSVPAQSVTGVNMDAAQSYVDRWYGSCPYAKANAWKQCANDVIARSKKACVDPLFALVIWIHESGASNYQCSDIRLNGLKVQDFGININSIAKDFSKQLDKFVQLPSAYVGNCPEKTLKNFIARFGPGVFTPSGHYLCYNELTPANQRIVDNYIGELQFIYSLIAPGVSLPTWPGSSGCSGR
jgi:hypothetical protein